MEGLTERVTSPAFATSVGLAHWGMHQADLQTVRLNEVAARAKRRSEEGVLAPLVNAGDWLRRALLPERGEG